jgi:hypothetical protein
MRALKDRVVIKVDVEQKNNTTFSDGTTIRLERDYNNLDRTYVSQVLGEVIDSEYIKKGALVLFHHNSIHDVNTVFDSDILTPEEEKAGFKIISIPDSECFLWKEKGEKEWHPMKNFCTALRVFKPYKGVLQGIKPTLIKNVLYLLTGEYEGKICHTLKAVDYQITFRNEKGVDESFIRCRHFEDDWNEREELIAIADDLIKQVKQGKLLIGLSDEDCKSLK